MKQWMAISMLIAALAWVMARNTVAAEASPALTLDEALRLALEQNPDVAEAQSRLAEAEARLIAAQAHPMRSPF